jgi:LPS export ABC transporter protein LptC
MNRNGESKILAETFILIVLCLAGACSFDYGELPPESAQPDITMRDVEYTRVREGNPQVHFKAELAERYEQRQTMELNGFSFEQYARGGEVNAAGSGGSASVDLNSGNIQLEGGIRISIESEDITIETPALSWQDEERILSGSEKDAVQVTRSDGTGFSGSGFSADARSRTWNFSMPVEGTYVHEDAENETEADAETADPEETGPDAAGPADAVEAPVPAAGPAEAAAMPAAADNPAPAEAGL